MSKTRDVEKKRKRQSQAADDASKKTSKINSGAKVSVVPTDAASMPLLASTSGLSIPPKASFQAYRKAKKNTHELLLHSSDHPRLNYTGREQTAETGEADLKHYVGIYDPERGTVHVVEARNVTVKTSLRSEDEEMRQQQILQKDAISLQRRALGQEFGTKKAKKAINSITENAVTSFTARGADPKDVAKAIKNDPNASAILASMDTSHPTRDEEQARIDEESARPKANLKAEKPEDVYNLKDVIGSDLLRQLKVKAWIDAVEEDQTVNLSSRFVANRLEELVKRDTPDMITRVKALKFILMGIEFYKAAPPVKNGGRKFNLAKMQDVLKADEEVLKMFKRRFVGNSNVMNKHSVNKLMTHIAATALLIDDLALDTYDLKEDLGMDQKTIHLYFSEIGAKIRNLRETEIKRQGLSKQVAAVHKIAELKLPLEFPKVRTIPQSLVRR